MKLDRGYAGIASIAAGVILSGFTPMIANAATHKPADQCNVTVHVRVDHSGNEFLNVDGKCAGHAPTAKEMKRLMKPFVLPTWIHVGDVHKNWALVWGGNGDTSAEVTRGGKAYVS